MGRAHVPQMLAFIAFAIAFVFIASADCSDSSDGQTPCGDNLQYEFIEDSATIRLFLDEGATTATMWNMARYPWADKQNEEVVISLPEGLINISELAFRDFAKAHFPGTSSIPSTVTTIGAYAFEGCTGLTSVSMPANLTTIGAYAFDGCTGLTSVSMPANLTTIGAYAFDGCTGLECTIDIPFGTTSIGAYAFRGCDKLSGTLTIPTSVTSIQNCAFQNCSGFDKMVFMDGCSGISPNAFYGITFYQEDKTTVITPCDEGFVGYIFQKNDDKMVRSGEGPETYRITYDADGGSDPAPVEPNMTTGQTFVLQPYSGTKTGYLFGGWAYNGKTYQPGEEMTVRISDINLKAVWLRCHSVTYDTDGGTGPAPQQDPVAEYSEFTIQGYSGSRVGFVFGGWKYNGETYQAGDKITMLTKGIILVANWLTIHNVTYYTNGGSEEAPQQDPVMEGSTFMIQSYSGTRTGFEFRGWIYDGNLYLPGRTITMGDHDVNLGAKWVAVHKVTYDLAGGSGDVPVQPDVAEGDTFTIQECTAVRQGFDFVDWVCDSTHYASGAKITMGTYDMEFVANWARTPESHHVVYDLNGGSGKAPTQADVKEGSTFFVKHYSGDKNGRAFLGWSYAGNIYNMGAEIKMEKKDITLVAVWEPDDFVSANIGIIIVAVSIIALAAAGTVMMRRKSNQHNDPPKGF